jgi:hypothetical protein
MDGFEPPAGLWRKSPPRSSSLAAWVSTEVEKNFRALEAERWPYWKTLHCCLDYDIRRGLIGIKAMTEVKVIRRDRSPRIEPALQFWRTIYGK